MEFGIQKCRSFAAYIFFNVVYLIKNYFKTMQHSKRKILRILMSVFSDCKNRNGDVSFNYKNIIHKFKTYFLQVIYNISHGNSARHA